MFYRHEEIINLYEKKTYHEVVDEIYYQVIDWLEFFSEINWYFI